MFMFYQAHMMKDHERHIDVGHVECCEFNALADLSKTSPKTTFNPLFKSVVSCWGHVGIREGGYLGLLTSIWKGECTFSRFIYTHMYIQAHFLNFIFFHFE